MYQAGSGIGRDTAITFAASSVCGLLLADINSASLSETATLCKEHAAPSDLGIEVVACDVSKKEDVDAMVKLCVDKFGRVDYGAHCAGVRLPPC